MSLMPEIWIRWPLCEGTQDTYSCRAISAIANSTDLAATIVPISLIPQIIFAGLIAPLGGWARGVGQFTGNSLDQRALGYLVRHPPGFLQDPEGRVLV